MRHPVQLVAAAALALGLSPIVPAPAGPAAGAEAPGSPAALSEIPPGYAFPGRRGAVERFPVGEPAPPLRLDGWVGGEPLEMDALRGRVVLVRWFTDTCPFCSTTAPVLVDLDRRYGERGLEVVGVFHPKPPGDDRLERARSAARRFGFTFPVGLDADWSALERWWLAHVPRGWTSVSFLVDRRGVIRWVHPGGEYHPGGAGPHWRDHASCNREHEQLVTAIERLLDEPADG